MNESDFITIYKVTGYNDADWGGPIHAVFQAYSRSISGAKLLGQGKDSWGTDCRDIKPVKAIEINDKIYIVDGPINVDLELDKKRDEIKRIALLKLNEEEKEALGVK